MRLPTLRTIAVAEIAGGGWGLFALVSTWPATALNIEQGIALGFIAVASFASIAAGWLLLRAKQAGYVASLVVQAAQIPRVALPGIAYALTLGLEITVRLIGWELGLHAETRVAATLWAGAHEEPHQLGANLLALLFFVALRRAAPGRESSGAAPEPIAPAV